MAPRPSNSKVTPPPRTTGTGAVTPPEKISWPALRVSPSAASWLANQAPNRDEIGPRRGVDVAPPKAGNLRYRPVVCTELIDINHSPYASAIEHLLDLGLDAVPDLMERTIRRVGGLTPDGRRPHRVGSSRVGVRTLGYESGALRFTGSHTYSKQSGWPGDIVVRPSQHFSAESARIIASWSQIWSQDHRDGARRRTRAARSRDATQTRGAPASAQGLSGLRRPPVGRLGRRRGMTVISPRR